MPSNEFVCFFYLWIAQLLWPWRHTTAHSLEFEVASCEHAHTPKYVQAIFIVVQLLPIPFNASTIPQSTSWIVHEKTYIGLKWVEERHTERDRQTEREREQCDESTLTNAAAAKNVHLPFLHYMKLQLSRGHPNKITAAAVAAAAAAAPNQMHTYWIEHFAYNIFLLLLLSILAIFNIIQWA